MMADRYITDRFLPDKALDVMDEAGARVHLAHIHVPKEVLDLETKIEELRVLKNSVVKSQNFEEAARLRDLEKKYQTELEQAKTEWESTSSDVVFDVSEEDVADVIAMMTGIPVNRIAEGETAKLLKMADELRSQVIGQDEAVEHLAKAIRRARAGLKDPSRPIGSFMFLGPTGVGKTELAKALARYMFDSEDAMIRIDMSEYMEKFSVSRLVGAPPGYVGYEEGGQLTEKVRRKPYSIVLLDEIEKAHPDVFNILLQVFDDGQLTDGLGRRIDFKNTIIIMTSNVGMRDVKAGGRIGFTTDEAADSYENMKSTVEETMKRLFNPEFLNRIDEYVIFRQLKKEHMVRIIELQLKRLLTRLSARSITLDLAKTAKEFLAEKGFDEKYGARPLRRTIQRFVEDPIAEEVLRGGFPDGSTIRGKLDKKTSTIIFTSAKSRAGDALEEPEEAEAHED
jgi:ATP-dependent Clp protease ATP-binding subunit ClpC